MITIQTVTSKIRDPNGTLSSGKITVQASEAFECQDAGSPLKITTEKIEVTIASGAVTAFTLAPTYGASHDKTGLYYIARFYTTSASWTEYWVIDGAGAASLEITSVIQTTPSSTVTAYISLAEVVALIAALTFPHVWRQATDPALTVTTKAGDIWIDSTDPDQDFIKIRVGAGTGTAWIITGA
jgi:hypothetical protein